MTDELPLEPITAEPTSNQQPIQPPLEYLPADTQIAVVTDDELSED